MAVSLPFTLQERLVFALLRRKHVDLNQDSSIAHPQRQLLVCSLE